MRFPVLDARCTRISSCGYEGTYYDYCLMLRRCVTACTFETIIEAREVAGNTMHVSKDPHVLAMRPCLPRLKIKYVSVIMIVSLTWIN